VSALAPVGFPRRFRLNGLPPWTAGCNRWVTRAPPRRGRAPLRRPRHQRSAGLVLASVRDHARAI